jgi:hypothetical protein
VLDLLSHQVLLVVWWSPLAKQGYLGFIDAEHFDHAEHHLQRKEHTLNYD